MVLMTKNLKKFTTEHISHRDYLNAHFTVVTIVNIFRFQGKADFIENKVDRFNATLGQILSKCKSAQSPYFYGSISYQHFTESGSRPSIYAFADLDPEPGFNQGCGSIFISSGSCPDPAFY